MAPSKRLTTVFILLTIAACAGRGDRASSGSPPTAEYVETTPATDPSGEPPLYPSSEPTMSATTDATPQTDPPATLVSSPSSIEPRATDGNGVFTKSIAPMLARNCAPCHVPGGKLYARLPFDSAQVVASHATSMLKRLSSPEDKRLLTEWSASQARTP